jgi:hypothetical protein
MQDKYGLTWTAILAITSSNWTNHLFIIPVGEDCANWGDKFILKLRKMDNSTLYDAILLDVYVDTDEAATYSADAEIRHPNLLSYLRVQAIITNVENYHIAKQHLATIGKPLKCKIEGNLIMAIQAFEPQEVVDTDICFEKYNDPELVTGQVLAVARRGIAHANSYIATCRGVGDKKNISYFLKLQRPEYDQVRDAMLKTKSPIQIRFSISMSQSVKVVGKEQGPHTPVESEILYIETAQSTERRRIESGELRSRKSEMETEAEKNSKI